MRFLAVAGLAYAIAAQPPSPIRRLALEAQVLATIHEIDSVEAITGTLAVNKATDGRLREFGRRLLLDRSAISPLWTGYSAAERLPAPPAPGVDIAPPLQKYQQQIEQARIASFTALPLLEGGDFDREFLRLVESSDKTGLAALAWARRQLPGSPLASVLDRVIPFYQQHYTIAAHLAMEQAMREGGR